MLGFCIKKTLYETVVQLSLVPKSDPELGASNIPNSEFISHLDSVSWRAFSLHGSTEPQRDWEFSKRPAQKKLSRNSEENLAGNTPETNLNTMLKRRESHQSTYLRGYCI
jgi:hypothetical protein